VLDAVWDLFVSLHATDEQMDFPVIYASAKDGYAKVDLKHVSGTMEPLFDAIIKYIPPPRAHAGEGFKLLVANLDYSDYLGRIAFGKIYSGKVKVGDTAVCIHGDGRKTNAKITAIFHFEGLKRIEIQEAHAGDVVGLTGFEDVFIGETITDSEERAPLPFVPIDPPSMMGRWPALTVSSLPRDISGSASLKKSVPTSRFASNRRKRRTSLMSAAVARCRLPSWSSRCGARATKSSSHGPRSFIAKIKTEIFSSPLKGCFWKSPRKRWAP
jgi:hypothetical protein